MLTQGQINHFDTFGFLVHRQAFDADETESLSREFESVCAQLLGRTPGDGDSLWRQPFVENSPALSRLVEDDRIYLPVQDLLGEGFLWGGSEGMWGFESSLADHQWHADGGWIADQMTTHRLKVMLYLDPQRRDTGALRIIPGSHRATLHEALVSFNDIANQAEPRYHGLPGTEVPCHPIETDPGDIVFFNNWLFHAVYGKVHPRRSIVLKFVEAPTTAAHWTEIREAESMLEIHDAFLESDSPRIGGLVERLQAAANRAPEGSTP